MTLRAAQPDTRPDRTPATTARPGNDDPTAPRPLRFLLESGTYQIDNVGDIAMLQRTVYRLLEAHPAARIDVITEQPDRLAQVLPEVYPVPAAPWFRLRVVPLPRWAEWTGPVRRVRWREKLLAGRYPKLARLGKRLDRWATRQERDEADAFYQAVNAADAVLAAGGGYASDPFHEHAWKVFATLNLAQGLGKPTAMFGLGLGPFTRPDLLQHGGPVLRRLDVLGLREPETGPAVAASLGVRADRVFVTGDDAIPLARAFTLPPVAQRQAMGVNLRLAETADVPPEALPRVSAGVRQAAEARDATLRPVIVRTALSPANDVDAVAQVFGPEVDLSEARGVRSPQEAMAQIARCRVVVTGAYHNAVFAGAMGVPVVGLSRSAYYVSKLGGAAKQFGPGVQVLSLTDPDLASKLTDSLLNLWDNADALAEPLRAAADRQTAQGEAAYERFLAAVKQPAATG
ncbi:MAG: polysaccharide pyruvyl transferase family protein [Phycisphaerae bacterium]